MYRRRVLLGATAVVSGLAGCSSGDGTAPTKTPTRTPDQDTSSPPYQLILINDTGEDVDASVEVRTQTPDEAVWTNTYELEDGEQRDLDVELEPGEYVLWCLMPDGPVETLFGHEWTPTDEPRLTIRFLSSSVSFE
jgi:hypothetical protein